MDIHKGEGFDHDADELEVYIIRLSEFEVYEAEIALGDSRATELSVTLDWQRARELWGKLGKALEANDGSQDS